MEGDGRKFERTWKRDDVVQIGFGQKEGFLGKLAIVEEVTGWGLMVRVETFTGDAYLRLPWAAEFAYIGQVEWCRRDALEAQDAPSG